MKKMSELRAMTADDRRGYLIDLLKERQHMRLRQGMGEAVKTHRYRVIKKMVAKIKTIVSEERRS